MTKEATLARENASSCEAKLHAFRKTQDGVVVSFVLHPQEVPAAIQLAPLGSRYLLAFVELGDDEKPKEVMPNIRPSQNDGRNSRNETSPSPELADTSHARAKKAWGDMPYAQQAGILCDDPKFVRFVFERGGPGLQPADYVRKFCDVQSRSEIRSGTKAEQRWNLLVSAYRAWELAPSVGIA